MCVCACTRAVRMRPGLTMFMEFMTLPLSKLHYVAGTYSQMKGIKKSLTWNENNSYKGLDFIDAGLFST